MSLSPVTKSIVTSVFKFALRFLQPVSLELGQGALSNAKTSLRSTPAGLMSQNVFID
jgi:hypothetical protein